MVGPSIWYIVYMTMSKTFTYFLNFSGYGNLAPTTHLSRILMIFYGMFGIPINGILLANLGEYFGTQVNITIYHQHFQACHLPLLNKDLSRAIRNRSLATKLSLARSSTCSQLSVSGRRSNRLEGVLLYAFTFVVSVLQSVLQSSHR